MIYELFGLPKRFTSSPRPSIKQLDQSEVLDDSADLGLDSGETSASATAKARKAVLEGETESIRFNVPEAIGIYLASHDKAIERAEIADLFFEKSTTEKIMHNLRSNLNKLRKQTEHIGLSEYLLTVSNRLELNVSCDVVDFERAFEEKKYQDVIDCYKGEFLEGFLGLRSAPLFNDWVDEKRTDLQDKYFVAYRELAHNLATDNKVAEALELLNTCIQKDVLHDKAPELCEQLLEIALHYGEAYKALNFYKDYKRNLRVQLEQLELLDSTDEPVVPEELEQLAEELKEVLKQSRITTIGINPEELDTSSNPLTPVINNAITKTSYIPPQATTFIGRDNELKDLLAQLLDANTRMISLIGYGGIGKTRLALQLAFSLLDYYVDGVFVVELVAVQAVENIPSTINAVLGISTEVGESPEDALNRVLKDKQLLLVLDNFEHLLAGRELIESLLTQHRALDVIVTSRELLGLAWEYNYPIKGLNYPELEEEQRIEDISDFEDYDAVKLFLRTAKARVKGFSLEDNQAAIQQICNFVEGLPLGIELAASWVASHSCEVIAETLEKDVSITTRLKDVPDRHKSLDVVFEHSWGLLDEQQQQVLAKTAIFHGGFDHRAADAVIGTSLTELADLCEKSLLRVDDNGRYSLHEVIRQNAVGKLVASPEVQKIAKTTHQKYYMEFIDNCDYFELNDNLGNIEAAWLSSIEAHEPNTYTVNVGETFQKVFSSQGLNKRGLSALDASLEIIQAKQDKEHFKLLEANLMRVKAYFLGNLGLHQEAQEYDKKVLTIAKELDEPTLLTNAFHKLAISYENSGKFSEAVLLLEKGLYSSTYPTHESLLLAELARVQSKQGNFDEAENNYLKSIALSKKTDIKQDIVHRKNNYSKLLLDLSRYEEAKAIIIETLDFAEHHNIQSYMYVLRKKLAQIYLEEENYTGAWSVAQQALNDCQEQEANSCLSQITAVLGDITLATSNIPAAKGYYINVLNLTTKVRDPDGKYAALIGFAKIHTLQEELAQAVTLLSSMVLQVDLRSSLKILVTTRLEELKNALSQQSYFKAFQKGNIEFVSQYCQELLTSTLGSKD